MCRTANIIAFSLIAILSLTACDFFGTGDNSPPVFDTEEERVDRAKRYEESPAKKIYGKYYQFISAKIDGKLSTPTSSTPPVLKLESQQVQGFDGCLGFSTVSAGEFTPSGYEYTLLTSGPFKSAHHDPDNVNCGGDEARWMDVYQLEDKVWKLSIDESGILTMSEYDGAPYEFKLKPKN